MSLRATAGSLTEPRSQRLEFGNRKGKISPKGNIRGELSNFPLNNNTWKSGWGEVTSGVGQVAPRVWLTRSWWPVTVMMGEAVSQD